MICTRQTGYEPQPPPQENPPPVLQTDPDPYEANRERTFLAFFASQ
jgi:hypothetical protein